MFVPMNVTFVSLRLAKPTFQVKVVARQIGVIAAHEQAYLKTGHDRAHLPLNQILAGPQLVAQDFESLLAYGAAELETNASANQTRFNVNSRTTYNVS
jgi:hypothetical protein